MKKITVCVVLLMISSIASAKLTRYTAEYYELYAAKFKNKAITLRVSELSIAEEQESSIKGYRYAGAVTYYKDQPGGTMRLYIPVDKVPYYLKKYGTITNFKVNSSGIESDFKTKPLKAVLKVEGDYVYAIIDPQPTKPAEKPATVKPPTRDEIVEIVKLFKLLKPSDRKNLKSTLKQLISEYDPK